MIDRQIEIQLGLFLWRTLTNKTWLLLRPTFQNSSFLRSCHWNPTYDEQSKKCYCGELGQTQRTGVDCICEGWVGETNKVSSTIHISIKLKKPLRSVLKPTPGQSTTGRRHNQSYQGKPQGYSPRLPACYFLWWCIRIHSRLFQETEWEVNRQNMWQMARVWAYLICEEKSLKDAKMQGEF